MSHLLVLGRGEQADRWSRLLSASVKERSPEALVVLNDHSAQAVDDLRQAMEWGRQRPEMPVAVLTLVDAQQPELQALVGALASDDGHGQRRISSDQAAALMSAALPPPQVRLDEEFISFEYQAM